MTFIAVLLAIIAVRSQEHINVLNVPTRPLWHTAVKTKNQLTIPFQEQNGLIYVAGRVESEEHIFIFDTGAPTLVLNAAPTATDESDFLAYSCHQEVAIGSAEVKRFEWAGQVLKSVQALTLDMTHFKEGETKLGGLIGQELYADRVVVVDYARERLSLVAGAQWPKMLRSMKPTFTFPLRFSEHLPVVELNIAGQSLYFGIDTGASTNLLSQDVATGIQTTHDTGSKLEVQGLDQALQLVPVTTVEHPLTAGEYLHFAVMNLEHLQTKEERLDGILGHAFLSKYQVAIDYPRQQLLLWERQEHVQ